MSGWKIATQANTIDGYEKINESEVVFDGSNLEPFILNSADFIIDPDVSTVATPSPWFFELENVNLPLEAGNCFFKLTIPVELELEFDELQATRMFSPSTRTTYTIPGGGFTIESSDVAREVSW